MGLYGLIAIGIVILGLAACGIAMALRGNNDDTAEQMGDDMNNDDATQDMVVVTNNGTVIKRKRYVPAVPQIVHQGATPIVFHGAPQFYIPAGSGGGGGTPPTPPALLNAAAPIITQTRAGAPVVITATGVVGATGILLEAAINGVAYLDTPTLLRGAGGGTISIPVGGAGLIAGNTVRARAATINAAGIGPWSADSRVYTVL